MGKLRTIVWLCMAMLASMASVACYGFTAADTIRAAAWADSVTRTMSNEEKVGQLFVYVVNANANAATKSKIKKQIEENKIGGVLFQKGTIGGQAELTNYMQSISRVPLLVTMDGEWGLQMRLSDALRYPRKLTMSAMGSDSLIKEFGDVVGTHCNLMGIHVNFDPVLDVNVNPENPVINVRAWSDDPKVVARNSYLFLESMRNHQVLCTAKHFPGHGDTNLDSHKTLPTVTHSMEQLRDVDMYPYTYLKERGMLDGVMVGHLSVPAIDSSGTPASLSERVVKGVLRDSLHFDGFVITDAMAMGAVAKLKDGPVRALKAGVDMVLDMGEGDATAKGIKAVMKALKDGDISQELVDERCRRVLMTKWLTGATAFAPIDLATIKQRINTPQALTLQQEMGRRAITLLKNQRRCVPLSDLTLRTTVVSVCRGAETYFVERCKLYQGNVETIYLQPDSLKDSAYVARMDSVLGQTEQAVIALHDNLIADSVVAHLCKRVKGSVTQVYFLSPYLMAPYVKSMREANAIMVCYENAQCVQYGAAEALYGGYGMTGRLPVAVPKKDEDSEFRSTPRYHAGKGLHTVGTRLTYGTAESVGMNSDTLALIDTIVKKAIEQDSCMPGCQVLVARKGRVVYRKSFGSLAYDTDTLKAEAVRASTVYDLASLTKLTATTMAVMKLVDENMVELDESVTHYLPRFKNLRGVTVRDLLTHQSGLTDARVWRKGHYSCDVRNRDSVTEVLRHVVPSKKKAYKYADINFMLLQRVVEEVACMSLDTYCTRNFYAPLGCTETGFCPDSSKRSRIAPTEYDTLLRHCLVQGTVHDEKAAYEGGVSGHAGLFSTSDDLAKLMQMVLNGGTYGGREYVSPATDSLFLHYKSAHSRRGLGFDRQTIPEAGSSSVLNETHTMVGHTGFTGTCAWIDPETELFYIFLSNRTYPYRGVNKLARTNVRTNIAEVIYRAMR